jgi:hypothetical protein
MKRTALLAGILSMLMAVVIFVFAEGLRRWYSGIFFALIGALLLSNAWRWRRATGSSADSA